MATYRKSKKSLVNDPDDTKGVDLEIDNSVKEICEVYNATSSATRTVIYVIVLVSIIAFTAVINTTRKSWTRSRIQHANATLLADEIHEGNATARYRHLQDSLMARYLALKKIHKIDVDRLSKQYQNQQKRANLKYQILRSRDSIKINVDIEQYLLLSRARAEGDGRVTIPLMGNSFDVNNLGHIAGITFIVLLVMLRFTLAREKDNLKIAFDAISERYPTGEFEKQYFRRLTLASSESNTDEFETPINFRRRRYHYNALSMSEIFNLPKLDVSRNLLQETKIGLIIKNHLFFSPYVVYTLIYLNDGTTFHNGWASSPLLTILSYSFGFLYWSTIAYLCESCNKQKRIISFYFDHFYDTNYYVERSYFLENRRPEFSIWTAIFFVPGIWIYYLNEPVEMRAEIRTKAKDFICVRYRLVLRKARRFLRRLFRRF